MTDVRSLRVRLVAAILIIACGAMFLYAIDRGARQAMADGRRYVDTGYQDNRVIIQHRIDQMREEFADLVPAGSSVRITEPTAFGSYWYILLGEFAAIHGVRLVEPGAPANYAVAVVEDGSGRFGVRMVVEELS